MERFVRCASAAILCAAMGTSVAYAQATRTWVSGVGDDANPCSRTAPCKTFAGAISKTAAGGEISVLDPGGFGAVTITKSITINGDGVLSGILATGTTGIIINALPTDVVVLRNLSIHGGVNGIRYLAGGTVVVDNCVITRFSQYGIEVAPTGDANLLVSGTRIIGAATAVRVAGSGRIDVSLDRVSITGTNIGLDAQSGLTTVNNSTFARNSQYGVLAQGGAVTVENSTLAGNGTALMVHAGATLRIANNGVYNNLTGFGCGGGTLASAGNNRKGGNVGGTGGACAPTAAIAVQ